MHSHSSELKIIVGAPPASLCSFDEHVLEVRLFQGTDCTLRAVARVTPVELSVQILYTLRYAQYLA